MVVILGRASRLGYEVDVGDLPKKMTTSEMTASVTETISRQYQ